MYLGCVANMDLSILGCVKVNVLKILCRFVGAEGELRRHPVAEGRCGFLWNGSRERREWCFFLPFLFMFVSSSLSLVSFGIAV